jgi:SpoVK/Ycf46/Vps4 family AAA+-type ATPase
VTLDRQGGKQVDTDKKRIEAISRTVAVSEPVVNLEQEILDYGLDEAIARAEVRDAQAAEEKKSSYIKRLSAEDQAENREAMLENEGDLVYVSPMLRGYALQNKLWLQFYVDDVQPVVWNDDAYEHLVYPEEQKDLVLSFVENHQRTRTSGLEMDDVIKGKGQGLVLLLSGPPGTGKTLTAEAVADKTRRPLYYLQAEDLGINAAQLGANLKKVFEMATEWDAVILLDEADVFMAERNPQDIARNELVSIFLRELEYFRGIIFLTTNLYNTIDSAFRSRVNIHLLFNSLSPEHRMILWKKFLERLPPMKEQKTIKIEGEDGEETQIKKSRRAMDFLSEDDMKELSQWDLNGREIKNAIKTVKSWCDAKAYDFSLSRLESGIRVTAPNTAKRAAADDSLYD